MDNVPGIGALHDARGYDPCEPITEHTVYDGTSLTPRDVAFDRSWHPCRCDEHTRDQNPDDDCEVCLGTGVRIYGYYCSSCTAGEEHECPACLGTGFDFYPRRSPWQYNADARIAARRAREQAEIEFYLATAEAEGLLPPADPIDSAEGRYALRLVVLESAERTPCKACDNGIATVNHQRTTCDRCKGAGSRPAVTANWLCNVDLNTEYDDDGVTKYGLHWPKHLPVERFVPFHTNDAPHLRPARRSLQHSGAGVEHALIPARPWRTSACGCRAGAPCPSHPVTTQYTQ